MPLQPRPGFSLGDVVDERDAFMLLLEPPPLGAEGRLPRLVVGPVEADEHGDV